MLKPRPTVEWFGPSWGAAINEESPKVPTPTEEPCGWDCGEPIVEGDQGIVTCDGTVFHHECFMRSIVGSAAHQLKKCSCYGGEWEDPPELTKRQAARLAVELWEEEQRKNPPPPLVFFDIEGEDQ